MASQYQHIKELSDFLGIDLRSSNIVRQNGFSSDKTRNVVHSPQGGLAHRPGSKIITSAFGKVGICRFDTVDLLGNAKTEIIGFGTDAYSNKTPYRLVNGTFVLTNNNVSHTALIRSYYDQASSQFKFTGSVNGVNQLIQGLGIGTEGSPYMLSSLITAINGTTDIAATGSPANASSTPAAFVETIADIVIAIGGTLTVNYWYWQLINVPNGNGGYASLGNIIGEVGVESYRNVSAVTIGGVLYVSSGLHTPRVLPLYTASALVNITKYDGQGFYRAGLPTVGRDGIVGSFNGLASPQTVTDDVRGHRTITSVSAIASRVYLYTNICIDKTGHRIETSSYNSGASGAAGQAIVNITAYDSSLSGKGFNNGYAVCSTGATSLTITVAGGQTLKIGDVAFFWDDNQTRFIQRVVTNLVGSTVIVSSQPIDIDPSSPTYDAGSTPKVLVGALITNNMRLGIYRNAGSVNGAVFYLLQEVPNWNVDSTLVYTYYDVYNDSDITSGLNHPAWIEPPYPRDMPTPGRYLASLNGLLIITGNELSPNTVYFSTNDSPEYHPAGTHNFDLPVACTGAGQTAEILACFGATRSFAVVGDLPGFNFRVEFLADQIGCASHATIQRIDEGILGFLSYKGPYVMYGGRQVVPMGAKSYPDGSKVSRIEPFFTARYGPGVEKPVLERGLAAILPQDRLYILFVPSEDPAIPTFATTNSVAWAYDWGRDAWWKWDGLNMAGGMLELNGQLYFNSRTYDNSGNKNYSGALSVAQQQQRDKGIYNCADHNNLINFEWRSHWESLGEPAMFKRFLRYRISNYEAMDAPFVIFNLNTYVNFDDTLSSGVDQLTLSSTYLSLKPKLKAEVCRSMQFALVVQEYFQPVVFTGFELEALADFRQEFKE